MSADFRRRKVRLFYDKQKVGRTILFVAIFSAENDANARQIEKEETCNSAILAEFNPERKTSVTLLKKKIIRGVKVDEGVVSRELKLVPSCLESLRTKVDGY